jgi:CDP-diacylglycerol--serine O-phosphatidyltransferase
MREGQEAGRNASWFTRFVHWLGYDLGVTPNQITVGRLLFFVPGWVMWVTMYDLSERTGIPWQAIGLAALVLVTSVIFLDLLDGALARETGQVSDSGKILDPAVDKLITYSTLYLFWPAITHAGFLILLGLDLASTFIRGVSVRGATEFGKKKALSQNISKFFFGTAVLTGYSRLNTVGNLLIWAAVFLAAVSVGTRVIPKRAKNPLYGLIPQVLTLCNLLCGMLAVINAAEGRPAAGILWLFAAMGFDLLDGAAARRLGTSSSFGSFFDTFADMVSFGVVPAVLVASTAGWAPVAVGGGVIYVAATCIRLYDYMRSKGIAPPGFFRGVPSPAAAWTVAAAVAVLPYPGTLAVMLIAAGLMCLFGVNWQHFAAIIPSLSVKELVVSMLIGMVPALWVSPLGFLAGPILVYLFSPFWRKPGVPGGKAA